MDLSPELDALIDRYTAMLRDYAAFAAGVRGEDVEADVEDDPRVEEFRWRLALLGAELDASFETETGVSAPVSIAYEPDEGDEDDDEDDDVDEAQLVFYVRGADDDLGVWLVDAGETLAAQMEARGYEVVEWTNVWAPAVPVDDYEDDADEDDAGPEDGGHDGGDDGPAVDGDRP